MFKISSHSTDSATLREWRTHSPAHPHSLPDTTRKPTPEPRRRTATLPRQCVQRTPKRCAMTQRPTWRAHTPILGTREHSHPMHSRQICTPCTPSPRSHTLRPPHTHSAAHRRISIQQCTPERTLFLGLDALRPPALAQGGTDRVPPPSIKPTLFTTRPPA